MPRVREVLARRDAVAQLAVVVGAFAAYEAARHLMEPNWAQAFANARRIESVEQVLGLAWEQSLQRAFLAIPDLMQALNVFYFVGHFIFTGIFFIWLYRRSWDGFRSFRDAFLIATAISVVVHYLFPTAPPRLAGVGLEDTLLLFSGIDIGSPTSSAYSNPVAAVPSLHAAYALGVGIGVVRYTRSSLVRVAGAIYPPLVILTIVVTGNHFVLDAVAGIAVLGAGFLAVGWWRSRKREPGSRVCAV
ncbi:MAG: phosphatase PAP2 family protein [Thermoleophilia bacterium]|nr:phosphatase PAP2 family protein [Thermoleophilia bacterium]